MFSATAALSRRRCLFAISFAALICGLTAYPLTQSAQAAVDSGARHGPDKDDTSIRPFHIHVPQAQLADLKRRIVATRWPDEEIDVSQGVPLATMQSLMKYWADGYDWRRLEATLNALPLPNS